MIRIKSKVRGSSIKGLLNWLCYGLLAGWVVLLSGCGAAQMVSEGAVGASKAIFVWDLRTIHLDLIARAELNPDDAGRSSPVVMRIYQLSDPNSFNGAPYQSLVDNDTATLGDSLIEYKEVVLKPDTAISLDIPFNTKANYIGIAALYRDPNLENNSWRLVIERGDLNIAKPRKVEASKYTISLLSEEE